MQRVPAPFRRALSDVGQFSGVFLPEQALRGYQQQPARAIAAAVMARRGGTRFAHDGLQPEGPAAPSDFGVVFSRQSGKDELLAQLLAYLLVLFQRTGGSVVVVLPTMRPQAVIARDRLVERLRSPRVRAFGTARTRDGQIVELGNARVTFLSGAPTANARGQTASLLLVCNEAQDVEPDRWDAVYAPMAAAEDACTLFLGTVWTASTLLARQMRYLRSLQEQDGARRLFLVPWREVAAELPAYGRYVTRQMAQLGAAHPFIQTEYELVELDADGGLFPPSRRGQMRGEHPPLERGRPGEVYALLVDVAGEEEGQLERVQTYDPAARRDATAATVVRVAAAGEGERPVYEVVRRYGWTGVKHTALYRQLLDLARTVWVARYVVVDATGVGAGLASFLTAALGERVCLPFSFSLASKSELGWRFLGIVDAGRFKDYDLAGASGTDDPQLARLTGDWWLQVERCAYEVMPGPNRLMKWSVPESEGHDDLLLSAALVGVLEEQDWRPRQATGFSRPIRELSR